MEEFIIVEDKVEERENLFKKELEKEIENHIEIPIECPCCHNTITFTKKQYNDLNYLHKSQPYKLIFSKVNRYKRIKCNICNSRFLKFDKEIKTKLRVNLIFKHLLILILTLECSYMIERLRSIHTFMTSRISGSIVFNVFVISVVLYILLVPLSCYISKVINKYYIDD